MKEKMNEIGTQIYVKIMAKLRNEVNRFREDESGVGIIEIALIVVIVIGLAMLFEEQITGFLKTIFKKYDISDLG